MKIRAPAKVNLFLRILAREPSGYHQLETLFAALDFGDTITLAPAGPGIRLEGRGPAMGPPRENLAFRAAKGFFTRGRVEGGVEIFIDKRIPVMGGLGGGSSDAGATLRGLDRLFPGALGEEALQELAASLGSDVPFFLSSSPLALARGRGERLSPVTPLPSVPVVLAIPPVRVGTSWAYESLARGRGAVHAPEPPRALLPEAFSSWEGVGALAENDFEEVVFEAYPVLGQIRQAMEETEPLFSLLSGSGSALFAVFGDQEGAEAAAVELGGRFPEGEFLLTRTLSTPFDSSPPSGG